MEMPLICCLYLNLVYRRGNKYFDVPSWRIRPVYFLSEDGKKAVYEWSNG